jgi:hypothetical protein
VKISDAGNEQEFRPSDIERLTEQLAQPEEQAVDQHVEGENPAALLVRRQRIQPTLDDDGKSRGIDADQKPQQRQRRDGGGTGERCGRRGVHGGFYRRFRGRIQGLASAGRFATAGDAR